MVNEEGYDAECGVVRVPITVGSAVTSRDVVAEINSHFHDGVLSFAAPKESSTEKAIRGGWAKPYTNTLSAHEDDQQKSVVAVSSKSFTAFKNALPCVDEVVSAVKKGITYKHAEILSGTLEAVEYTLFFGKSTASCTKWHNDSDEHPSANLEFTSLTLLTEGPTSMCIAGKEETYLRDPFDTVLFDPDLFHRSDLTHHYVIKLSIHWKVLSGGGARGATAAPTPAGKAKEGGAPIKVKVEEPPHVPPAALMPIGEAGQEAGSSSDAVP